MHWGIDFFLYALAVIVLIIAIILWCIVAFKDQEDLSSGDLRTRQIAEGMFLVAFGLFLVIVTRNIVWGKAKLSGWGKKHHYAAKESCPPKKAAC